MKSILDPSFVYTPACKTDIRKRFDQMREAQKPIPAPQATSLSSNAVPLPRRLREPVLYITRKVK